MAGAALGTAAQAAEPALYAYSTISALLAGSYDGDATVAGLRRHGDFGLGTFNALDGEMLTLDGVCYHVRADGSVKVAADEERSPLAFVLPFQPTLKFSLDDAGPLASLSALEARLDTRLSNANLFYAVRLHAEFEHLSARAIPAQVRPYKTLAESAKQQLVFQREHVAATLIGLRSPEFSKGVSVPGWHWHVLSDDKHFGGHLLDAALRTAEVQVSTLHQLVLDLPASADFAAADQSRDRGAELHQVETAHP